MDKPRLKSLDILRGVAILLVFVNHLEPRISPAIAQLHGLAGFVFWHVKGFGWTGVDFFFVISGFLISGLLFDELDKTGRINWGRFWLRRGFKIWPSYFLLLLVLGLTGVTGYIDPRTPLTVLSSVLPHVLFLQNYLPAGNPNGPTWSLAVEEHFYLFLPVVLTATVMLAALTRRKWSDFIPALTLFVVLACLGLRVADLLGGAMNPADYTRTHLRMDALMIGVWLNCLVRNRSRVVVWIERHPRPALGLAFSLVAPALLVSRINPFMFTVGFPLLSAGYGILLVVVYHGLLQPVEGSWVMTGLARLGLWSYNVYLWHYFVVLLPLPGYAAADQFLAAHLHHASLLIASQSALFMFSSIAIGAVLTVLVENPLLKLRNRWWPSPSRILPETKTQRD